MKVKKKKKKNAKEYTYKLCDAREASILTTHLLAIKTMSLASVAPSGLHTPPHLLTTAIHTHPEQQAVAGTPPPLRRSEYCIKILLQIMSSSCHMLSSGGGACTLCSLGKSGCHTEETQEDRCSVCLSTSLGWRSWEIKGGVKTVT